VADAIRIDGLSDFRAQLRKAEGLSPAAIRKSLNTAVEVVSDYGRKRMPRRTGRAASTIKGRSTQTEARVQEGGRKAPYVPWLDFGGRVGRRRSVRRAFYQGGRYLYPALDVRREQLAQALSDALTELAEEAGWEVSNG